MQGKREIEEIAIQLHTWYLIATRELNPENYNPKAQKPYSELNDEQKQIDRLIAKCVLSWHKAEVKRVLEELKLKELVNHKPKDKNCKVYYITFRASMELPEGIANICNQRIENKIKEIAREGEK